MVHRRAPITASTLIQAVVASSTNNGCTSSFVNRAMYLSTLLRLSFRTRECKPTRSRSAEALHERIASTGGAWHSERLALLYIGSERYGDHGDHATHKSGRIGVGCRVQLPFPYLHCRIGSSWPPFASSVKPTRAFSRHCPATVSYTHLRAHET